MTNYRKRLKSSRLLCLLAMLSFATTVATAQDKPQDIESSLSAIASEVGIPGMQIAHYRDSSMAFYTFGRKNIDLPERVNQETIFQAASLTKVVTAYVFLRLMDQGLIDLDTPLYALYPYDRLANTPNKELITARMVLTHRTGMHNWEGDVPTAAWRATPLTLTFKPGMAYAYSGEGFYLLQEVMEHITKKPFEELVQEQLIIPFGMRQSTVVWDDKLEENIAYGHLTPTKSRSIGKYRKANAAYTLYTTAADYTKFIQKGINAGEGLSDNAHQLLLTKQGDAQRAELATAEDAHVPCALGLRMQINEAGTAVWHTGSNPGFRCFFISYPATGESLAVFMNVETGFAAMGKLLALFLNDDNNKQTFWAYEWRKGELD